MSGPLLTSVAESDSQRLEPRLRLWPGIVIVALMLLIRVIAGMGASSPRQFFIGFMITPMVATVALLLWWILASRLRWTDRLLVVVVFAVAAGATVLISGGNFPVMGLILYALPVVTSVWVGWLLLTMWLKWPLRRAGLTAAIVLAWCFFMLLRVDGMNGVFAAQFNWRWAPTAEQKMLAELAALPHPAAAPSSVPAADKLELQPGDWPGFRGAARDGRLSGVRIATDWQKSPPRQLWRHRIGPGWSSFAVVGSRAFTQEQRGDEELVVCYDAATGAELWTHADKARFTEIVAGPGPRGTPTFDDGVIYALGASGHLSCLDATSGAVRWTKDIVADSGAKVPQWGFSSSPLVVDGIVSVFAGGPGGKSVLGYRAETGELAWAAGEGQLSYCSPQLARLGDTDQLLISTDVGLTAFRPQTGEILWDHRWPTEGVARIVQPTVIGDSDVLIGTGMGVGTRRISVGHDSDTWPIKELWTSRSIKPYYNDLVVQNDCLYGFDGNIFMCVSLDDGRIRWRHRGYGNGQALLLTDQNLLLVLTEEGEVALVEAQPERHKEVARFKAIEGKTWNHPVIAHNKLFVRNGEEVACFELQPLADSPAQAAAATP